MASKITFSTRALTLGELELLAKAAHDDPSAGIDLIVARSEPKVTREYVCALTESEGIEVLQELSETMRTLQFLRTLLGSTE
jgi:hypothetical protein